MRAFNTLLQSSGIALQGEISYRQDVPLQLDDIELLLNSKRYRFGRAILRALIPFNRLFHFVKFCTLLLLKNPYRVANSCKLRLQQLAAKRL